MFGITTTRRLRAELAIAKAETDRQRDRAEKAEAAAATAKYNRGQALSQLAAADAANRRLHDRNLELGRRISALTESDPEYAARLERRVARLRLAGKRIFAAYGAQKKRADRLQQRLDDACGLNAPAVLAGSGWQSTRHDKKTGWAS
jgi:predicted RNase H-like nuclease (RuvC/YqgF family)